MNVGGLDIIFVERLGRDCCVSHVVRCRQCLRKLTEFGEVPS